MSELESLKKRLLTNPEVMEAYVACWLEEIGRLQAENAMLVAELDTACGMLDLAGEALIDLRDLTGWQIRGMGIQWEDAPAMVKQVLDENQRLRNRSAQLRAALERIAVSPDGDVEPGPGSHLRAAWEMVQAARAVLAPEQGVTPR